MPDVSCVYVCRIYTAGTICTYIIYVLKMKLCTYVRSRPQVLLELVNLTTSLYIQYSLFPANLVNIVDIDNFIVDRNNSETLKERTHKLGDNFW